jgi:hypothetical protein
MANLQNLKPPWKKGQSGNPKGRPPGKSYSGLLRYVSTRDKLAIVQKMVELAMRGNIGAANWIAKLDARSETPTEISIVRAQDPRIVWELAHRQLLPPWFWIHHIDGDHSNNDPGDVLDGKVGNLAPMWPEQHRRWHCQDR